MGIGRQYAYRLIAAAEALTEMAPMGDKLQMPTSERQIRPLVGLSKEKRFVAWGSRCSARRQGVSCRAILPVVLRVHLR